jgi:hypothetical protein
MIDAILREKMVAGLITELDIDGIISDNRLGVFSKKVTVFITHQLNVMTGNTTCLQAKFIKIIKKFTACCSRF